MCRLQYSTECGCVQEKYHWSSMQYCCGVTPPVVGALGDVEKMKVQYVW